MYSTKGKLREKSNDRDSNLPIFLDLITLPSLSIAGISDQSFSFSNTNCRGINAFWSWLMSLKVKVSLAMMNTCRWLLCVAQDNIDLSSVPWRKLNAMSDW